MTSTLVETVSIDCEDFNESFLTCGTCLCKWPFFYHFTIFLGKTLPKIYQKNTFFCTIETLNDLRFEALGRKSGLSFLTLKHKWLTKRCLQFTCCWRWEFISIWNNGYYVCNTIKCYFIFIKKFAISSPFDHLFFLNLILMW